MEIQPVSNDATDDNLEYGKNARWEMGPHLQNAIACHILIVVRGIYVLRDVRGSDRN